MSSGDALFAALEDAAMNVIQVLKSVPEFSDAKLAIIGGMAVLNYLKKYRNTDDVDFVITVKDAPKTVKEKLLKLPNTPFVGESDFFYYKPSTGCNIQIDMCFSERGPFLPDAARVISTIEPTDPLPYIGIVDLLVFKINSCGLRADQKKKNRDAVDAKVLLGTLVDRGPFELNALQKEAVEEGLKDVMNELGLEADAWKPQLGI